jgi:hypothetical protein
MGDPRPGKTHHPDRVHTKSSLTTKLSLLPLPIIAIAWWLISRPYGGVIHDGVLYTTQALKHLYPERYAQDIFFLYGSQDSFTLFSKLHSWLIGLYGVDHAFLLLSVAGGAIWLYALLSLLSRWLSAAPLVAAFVLIMSWNPYYGGWDIFSYGERFATPRLFSEALVLLSITFWLDKRPLPAICFVFCAALLHPIITVAGIGILGWSVLRERFNRPVLWWWLVLGAGLLGMQLGVWLGLSPRLDPSWRHAIELRSPFVFPYLWKPSDWLRLVLDATLLGMAARHVQGEAGRLAAWVLAVLLLCILWALGAGLMGVQLAVAAQLQRVQWLAHLLALALVVPLCMRLWQTSAIRDRYLVAGIAGSLVSPLNLGGLVLPFVYGLTRWAERRMGSKALPRTLHLFLLLGIPLMGLALWLFYLSTNPIFVKPFSNSPFWLTVLRQAPVALGGFIAIHFLCKRLQLEQAGFWIYGLVLLAIGIPNWDIRKPWSNYEQAERTAAIAPVKKLISEHAVVYWERAVFVNPENKLQLGGGVEQLWFWLERASYVSSFQAAGNVFYRQTALEISRRISHLRQWGFRDNTIDRIESAKIPEKLTLTEARLRGVCSDPVLDFVITDAKLPAASLSFRDPLTEMKFSVYDCRMMRPG